MRKLLLVIAASTLLPLVAQAQWDGFPLSETNAHDWDTVMDSFGGVSQLWWSASERWDVAPSDNGDSFDLSDTRIAYAGYTNDVFTTNSWTYTNRYLVYTNLTRPVRFDFGNATNFGPWEYTYTDPSGTYTNSAGFFLNGQFIYEWDASVFNSEDGASDQTMCEKFISTNQIGSDGTFDDYFALVDGAGETPSTWPLNSRVGLLNREGIGYTTNLVTNAWGFIQSTGAQADDAAWFTRATVEAPWSLAQAAWTGSWTFVDLQEFDRDFFDTENLPVVRLIAGGTNAITNLNVEIQGSYLDTYSDWWINDAQELQPVSNATETVSLSDTNWTACTLPWYGITNMVMTNSAFNTGDVVIVSWTNDITTYGQFDPEFDGLGPHVLKRIHLDERYRAYRAMRISEEAGDWTADSITNNRYSWTGSGDSWAAAKTDCEAAVPAISSVDSFPEYYTKGSRVGDTWTAVAVAVKAKVVTSGTATNYAHGLMWYGKVTAFDSGIDTATFDNQGFSWKTNQYQLLDTNAPTYGASVTSSAFYGDTTFPPNWCDEPQTTNATSKGWEFETPILVGADWYVTNGFRFQD